MISPSTAGCIIECGPIMYRCRNRRIKEKKFSPSDLFIAIAVASYNYEDVNAFPLITEDSISI